MHVQGAYYLEGDWKLDAKYYVPSLFFEKAGDI